MTRIVGLSGSLRRGSLNTALLRAARSLLPPGASLELADIRDVPLYNGDLEAASFRLRRARLKEQVAGADALLIATPEYNHSIPGVLKNVLDWMSRPPPDQARVFLHRPVAILGASPGGFGTARAQPVLLPVLRALRTRVFCDSPAVLPCIGRTRHSMSRGKLTDPIQRDRLADFLREFVSFAARK